MRIKDIIFYNKGQDDFWTDFLEKKRPVLTLNGEIYDYLLRNGIKIPRDYIVTADGVGIVIGNRIIGKVVKKNNGFDLFSEQFKKAPNLKIFLWGASPDVIESAAKKMEKKGYNVLGFNDGYNYTKKEVFVSLQKLGVELVYLGMNTGKQINIQRELWRKYRIPAMTVGGSFDVISGEVKRAPRLFQDLGLEWLWRVMITPSRVTRLPLVFKIIVTAISERVSSRNHDFE